MKVNQAELDKVAVNPGGYPQTGLPEIAFVGKSNVGKSSLINSLVNRRALARTSGQPGKTRTINFFLIEKCLYFVDLPGYGYAKVSKSEKEKWGGMIEAYLKERETLQAVVLLIDIRHPPSANDKMMFDWFLYYGHRMIVVATKSDKIKRSQLSKHTAMIRKELGLEKDQLLIPFSSETKAGKEELWQVFDEMLAGGDE